MKKGLLLIVAAVVLSGCLWCVSSGQEALPWENETGQSAEAEGFGENMPGQDGREESEADLAEKTGVAGTEAGAGPAETEEPKEMPAGPTETGEPGKETQDWQDIETGEAEPAAPEPVLPDRPKVRGIYVTGPMAGTANMDNLIALVERTELNAMVIDIKNDDGYLTCEMDVPLAQEIGAVKRYVKDMPGLVQKCKEKGIYLIARIVAFKDPHLAEAMPDWSLHNADGTIFRDKNKLAWVNPYEPQVWDYLVQIAQGAVELGFDEVQFDYIRFSTDRGMKQVDFGTAAQEKGKTEIITEFAAYAADQLHQMGAAVSADVYGVVIDSATDQQIVGQDYVALAGHLDYISPMIYPSHYGPYNYNIPIPDAQPYDTVLAAMQASKKVLAGVLPNAAGDASGEPASEGSAAAVDASGEPASEGSAAAADDSGTPVPADGAEDAGTGSSVSGNALPEWSAQQIAALPRMDTVRADVRPWLQDFTATWVKGHIKYGPQQIRDQIQAVYDAGYEEWILWNAANRYTEGGLNPAENQGGM